MTETPEERAKRLGLTTGVPESAVDRAKRLGLPDDDTVEVQASYPERLATTILKGAQVIPGVKALEAWAGSGPTSGTLGHPDKPGVSYADARAGLDEQTDRMGKTRGILAQAASSPAMVPAFALRGISALSPALQGAAYGATSEAADFDPNETNSSRLRRTGTGAAVGAVVGKGVDVGGTLLRAKAGPAVQRIVGGVGDAVKRITPRQAPAPRPAGSLDDQLRGLLKQVGATPADDAAGRLIGDAEVAQGMDAAPLDLEALLAQSIKHVKGGGRLNTAKNSVPTYAGRPVAPRIDHNLAPSARAENDALLGDDLGGLAREGAEAKRAGLLDAVRNAPLPEMPTLGARSVLRRFGVVPAARDDAVKVASRVSPDLRKLDQQLGSNIPAILRAAGISTFTP